MQESDHWHRGRLLLRMCRERPREGHASDKCDELPPSHSRPSSTMTRPDYQISSTGRSGDCCIAIASSGVGLEHACWPLRWYGEIPSQTRRNRCGAEDGADVNRM